eukprot:3871880-Alexandrium_andersonii.AAC.1
MRPAAKDAWQRFGGLLGGSRADREAHAGGVWGCSPVPPICQRVACAPFRRWSLGRRAGHRAAVR